MPSPGSAPPVLVVGSCNADVRLAVAALPAPGETVIACDRSVAAGGKGANQAARLAALGRPTALVGCIGDDANGRLVEESLATAGVELTHLHRTAAPTGVATVVVDEAAENLIVVDPGANAELRPAMLEPLGAALAAAPAVVLQGEIPWATTLAAARAAGGAVVLNVAPAVRLAADDLAAVDVLVANRGELAVLLGAVPAPAGTAGDTEALGAAMRRVGVPVVVVTLGAEGAAVLAGGTLTLVPALPVDVVDTTGAGDCFTAALVDRLVAGEPAAEATRFAVAAAALATTGPGALAGPAGPDEVRALARTATAGA